MDPSNANPDSMEGLRQLFQLGGNGAAMAAVWLGWQIWKQIRDTLDRNTRSNYALQRAVATLNPEAARILDEHERQENERAMTQGKT